MRSLITVVALGLPTLGYADTIALWTFETSQPAATDSTTIGGIAPEGGAGTASGVHASASTDWSNPAGNGSAESFSSNNWATGDYYQFAVSTLGLENIQISWHQTRSGTGPGTFDLEWSLDGTNFSTLSDDYAVSEESWSSGSTNAASIFAPVAAPATAANQSEVYFRLVSQVDSAAGGTNRIDNVHIEGTTIVPLPPAAWGGLGLMGLIAVSKARRGMQAIA